MGNCWRRKRCEYFVEIRCWNSLCCIATSHTNTHTVRSRPTPKNEIRHFRNGLVRELKVDERKLLRHSKRLCSNRRKQFLGSQCHTSYLESNFGERNVYKVWEWRDFDNWRWLQQELCERERGAIVCVACRQSDGLSTRGSKTQLPWFRNRCERCHYYCSSFSFV